MHHMLPFAHIVGLPGRNDPLPGLDDASGQSNRLSDASTSGRLSIVVPLSTDPATAPLRKALLSTVRSCQELWAIVRRLGLPENSVRSKFPFHR